MTEEFDRYATPTCDIWQQNSGSHGVPWSMARSLECDKRIAEQKLRVALECLHFIAQNNANHESGRLCTEILERIEKVAND